MNTRTLMIGIVSVSVAALIVLFAMYKKPNQIITPSIATSTSEVSEATQPAPPLSKDYKNSEYRFSVLMPADFDSRELPADDGGFRTILLQGPNGDGIQILVSKYPGDTKVIMADDVRTSIPDMKVTEEQAVEIGNSYKGVAFKSDNEAFGGASREVWFVFKGNLYQISTYTRLDPLLQAMFATWKFF